LGRGTKNNLSPKSDAKVRLFVNKAKHLQEKVKKKALK
jgi:hypothetical protein